MRKLSLIAANVFLAATVLFTSCKKEDDGMSLTLNTISGDEYVTGSADVDPATTFKVGLTIQKLDKNLSTFSISASTDAGTPIVPEVVSIEGFESSDVEFTNAAIDIDGKDRDGFTIDVTMKAPADAGMFTYTYTVTDNDGNIATKEIMINTGSTSASFSIDEYTAKLLGGQLASEGSYFSSSTGEVYSGSEFDANKGIIDITYAQTGPDAASITDKIVSSDYRDDLTLTSGTGGMKVYYSISGLDYDNVTTEQLSAISASSSQYVEVDAGDVVEYVTAAGEKGLIKVNDITNPDDAGFEGVLDISVKVLVLD